jgi:hypothetical protein
MTTEKKDERDIFAALNRKLSATGFMTLDQMEQESKATLDAALEGAKVSGQKLGEFRQRNQRHLSY